jgi:hypothetical protein
VRKVVGSVTTQSAREERFPGFITSRTNQPVLIREILTWLSALHDHPLSGLL